MKPIAVRQKESNPLDLYQSRAKIYPRQVTGRFESLRIILLSITLGIYFVLPWLHWDERQAILFDIPNRAFHVFMFTFWPQDFILLCSALIIASFALFFFTNLLGRVWCGYTCPQTVWTKVFFLIENFTEGSRNRQIKQDLAVWSFNKLIRKTIKHTLWLFVSALTGITFVGYFAPIGQLFADLTFFQLSGWACFWILFFTLATYLNAGWMREQVCIYMCPYARFQSVMFDSNTLIVAYDAARGEPRGNKKENEKQGDCIQCYMCVQVCPTGIDIRDGLQLECIGCAACIDACDGIMDQIDKSRGLIKYTSEKALQKKPTQILRPRLVGYGVVLLIMICTFSFTLFSRKMINLTVMRDRNALYRETTEGMIENTYTLSILNMSQKKTHFIIELQSDSPMMLVGSSTVLVAPGEVLNHIIHVEADPTKLKHSNEKINFKVSNPFLSTDLVLEESRFISPGKF